MLDATYVDTFASSASSYRSLVAHAASAVAARAEILKEEKHSDLLHTHEFVPVAIKSSGVFGPRSLSFVNDLGREIRYQTAEEKPAVYLLSTFPLLCSGAMQYQSWGPWTVSVAREFLVLFIHILTHIFLVVGNKFDKLI